MLKRYLENDLPPAGTPERKIIIGQLSDFHNRLQGQIAHQLYERGLDAKHPRLQTLSDTLEQVSRKLYDSHQKN